MVGTGVILTPVASSKSTNRELVAFEVATRDLVGVALRSVTDLEVSLPQFRLLWVLDEMGEVGATRCAEELGVAGSSVTRLVDRLHASGHLDRRSDPANRSAVVLALTGVGREVVEQVKQRRRDELTTALARLSRDERERCVAALERLHEVIEASGDPRVPY